MKKTVLLVMFLIFVLVSVHGQNAPIDLILVLDTSSQMGSSYEYVNDYLTGSFLREFIRVGDTFHLIPFSAVPRLDVARRISGVGDVETIIGRMLLQYPVESGFNLSSALTFTEQYAASLPYRDKKIVIVTLANTGAADLVNSARQRLSSSNTTIDYIQVTPGRPLTNVPVSGRTPMPGSTAPVQTAAPEPAFDPIVTETFGQEAFTLGSTDTSGAGTEISSDFTDTSTTTGSALADTPATSSSTDTTTVTSRPQTTPSATDTAGSRSSAFPSPLLIIIILLALVILALIIYFATRNLGSKPTRVMSETVSEKKPVEKRTEKPVEHTKELSAYAVSQTRRSPYDDLSDKNKPVEISPTGPLLLNLFVEEQNTAIGKRNIHSLKSGYSFTVGGSKSDDYLIFLVPIPANIGIIRRNGRELTFIPRKAKYFPDIGSKELRNCINKTIRIVSDKNYEIRFRFEMYEDPLVSLNKIMNSVRVPG